MWFELHLSFVITHTGPYTTHLSKSFEEIHIQYVFGNVIILHENQQHANYVHNIHKIYQFSIYSEYSYTCIIQNVYIHLKSAYIYNVCFAGVFVCFVMTLHFDL